MNSKEWIDFLQTKPVYNAQTGFQAKPEATITIPDCVAERETEKALLVDHPDWETPLWFPHSQIQDDSEVYAAGCTGDLVITEWIAQKKGLL